MARQVKFALFVAYVMHSRGVRIEGSPAVSTYTLIPVVPPILLVVPFSSKRGVKKAHSASRCTEQCNREAWSHIAHREKRRSDRELLSRQETSKLYSSFALTILDRRICRHEKNDSSINNR